MTSQQPIQASRALLDRVYREHRQGLFTLALSLTRQVQAAEDAVQEAFARLCRRDRLPEGDPIAYVFATVRNAAIDWLRGPRRREKTNDAIFESTPTEPTPSPLQSVVAGERDRLVREAVERLPDEQREVLVMKLYAGLTFQQIASAMDEPLSTVSSRYQRAIEKLRTQVESLV